MLFYSVIFISNLQDWYDFTFTFFNILPMQENDGNFWDLMTFNFITPVTNHGVVKQLHSDDLLPLPTDMGPSSCHDVILSC